MTPVSPGQAARILHNLVDRLTDTRQLRRGYAFEAAGAMLDHARDTLQLPVVMAICSPANTSSIGLLNKLGFAAAGRTRLPGENHDVLVFEWLARQSQVQS